MGTNCYILHEDTYGLIVDPGGDPEKIIQYLTVESIVPEAILLTHAHFDHIGGVSELRTYYNIDVYLHDNEASWLENSQYNGSSMFMGTEITTDAAEQSLTPGNKQIGGFPMEIVHTPGHSPGSVSFIFHEHACIVSGDVLFNNGIGRTDLPGGDINKLERSIRDSLYQLPGSFTVYPGHGPETTIENEKQSNPFFKA
nr:MBL fold metallo-hydrolase [Lentibacillus persicus]